jgi:hypothetical protein
LGLNVITSKNYGASLEDWFDKYSGKDMIDFLRNNTDKNLVTISEFLD